VALNKAKLKISMISFAYKYFKNITVYSDGICFLFFLSGQLVIAVWVTSKYVSGCKLATTLKRSILPVSVKPHYL
jgi:hypothetical protein